MYLSANDHKPSSLCSKPKTPPLPCPQGALILYTRLSVPEPTDNLEENNKQGNRAVDRFQIFEAVALERLQAGADATKPAAFLPLPVRLTAIAAAAIAGVGVLWSVLARVPVQVNGTGAIVPPGGLGSLTAATNGQLQLQVSGLGPTTLPAAQLQRNAQLQHFWGNDAEVFTNSVNATRKLQQLVTAALMPVRGEVLSLPEDLNNQESFDQAGRSPVVSYTAGTLLAQVLDVASNQELNSGLLTTLPTDQLQSEQQAQRLQRSQEYNNLGQLQSQQRLTLSKELQQRRQLYQRYQTLWKQGYLPATTLLDEQNRINTLEGQLLNADGTVLNTQITSKDQLDQAKQAKIQNIDSRSKLENLLISYLNKTSIFAPDGGFYLLARNFRSGSLVKQGDELFAYTTTPPALPKEVPVYLDAVAAQQVTEGMTVLLTPKGISRAEYGGIPGRVVEVKKLPIVGEALLGQVGSRAIATTIQQLIPAPYLVKVALEQAEPNYCRQALSRRCYRWSSNRLPPHPVRLATLADVQITTIYRRPVEFVMPGLRRALGLVVDNP